MIQMFKQLFNSITVLFLAMEKTASAANHMATWMDEAAGAFADEARNERAIKQAAMKAERTRNKAQLEQVA